MKYTILNLENDISKINQELSGIRSDRGKRYGAIEDALKNVRDADPEGSWRAAYIAAVENLNRIRNMFMTPTVEQDIKDFENATDDLINYAYYIKILGRQKRVSTPTKCEAGKCQIKPFVNQNTDA